MKIGACVITYNPDFSVLRKGIESLQHQVKRIIIVDNGSVEINELRLFCENFLSVELISLKENKGIAFATNVALREFLERDYDFVLISDQDSNYPDNYVKNFKDNLAVLHDGNIAAFVPVFFDENENDYAKIIIKSRLFMRKVCATEEFTDVFHAIASGMIICLALLRNIGMMNEDLFIDWVDLEWCWKVHYYNKRIVCCKNLTIHHKLGDSAKNLGYRTVSIRSWIRNYYITRNSFYLALYTKYLGRLEKFILFFKSFRYIVGYTILCDAHIKNFYYTLKGMHDGIHKKMGKIKVTGKS